MTDVWYPFVPIHHTIMIYTQQQIISWIRYTLTKDVKNALPDLIQTFNYLVKVLNSETQTDDFESIEFSCKHVMALCYALYLQLLSTGITDILRPNEMLSELRKNKVTDTNLFLAINIVESFSKVNDYENLYSKAKSDLTNYLTRPPLVPSTPPPTSSPIDHPLPYPTTPPPSTITMSTPSPLPVKTPSAPRKPRKKEFELLLD
jgi:hypothetical protein